MRRISSLLASLLATHAGGVSDISSSLLASLLVTHVGGVPDLAAFGPTAPDNVLELTSGDRKAAREAMRRHPTRFAVLMMAPRVGSKMLWSQLRSYRPGIVHMLMEGNDARLKDELPNATVAERVEALLSKAEAIAIRRTPHHRGRLLCGNQPVCRVHSAMTRPRWPRRAVRNRQRHRRDDSARTRHVKF